MSMCFVGRSSGLRTSRRAVYSERRERRRVHHFGGRAHRLLSTGIFSCRFVPPSVRARVLVRSLGVLCCSPVRCLPTFVRVGGFFPVPRVRYFLVIAYRAPGVDSPGCCVPGTGEGRASLTWNLCTVQVRLAHGPPGFAFVHPGAFLMVRSWYGQIEYPSIRSASC